VVCEEFATSNRAEHHCARASTKVRIARWSERAQYEAEVAGASTKEELPLVYLKEFKS
jgi:hypothetical protein